jgi:hypothetical protein
MGLYGMFLFFGAIVTVIVLLVRHESKLKPHYGGYGGYKPNAAPMLTVEAVVVAKYVSKNHHGHSYYPSHGYGSTHTPHNTTYMLVFQVESGDKLEFYVNSADAEHLPESSRGMLTFQATRFIGFEQFITPVQ